MMIMNNEEAVADWTGQYWFLVKRINAINRILTEKGVCTEDDLKIAVEKDIDMLYARLVRDGEITPNMKTHRRMSWKEI